MHASLWMLPSSISSTLDQANFIATRCMIVFMLFDGSWMSLDKIPLWWDWLRYFSFMGYGAGGDVQ